MQSSAASHIKISLFIYTLLVVLVTAASWAIYLRHSSIYTRPLFTKDDQFHDLTNYAGKTAHLYHGAAALGSGLPTFNYPAP